MCISRLVSRIECKRAHSQKASFLEKAIGSATNLQTKRRIGLLGISFAALLVWGSPGLAQDQTMELDLGRLRGRVPAVAENDRPHVAKGQLLPSADEGTTGEASPETVPADILLGRWETGLAFSAELVPQMGLVEVDQIGVACEPVVVPARTEILERYFLRFEERVSLESDHDWGRIYLRVVGESDWKQVGERTGAASLRTSFVDVTAYTGQSVELRFVTEIDESIEFEGWFVGNMSLAKVAAPAGVLNLQISSLDPGSFPYIYLNADVTDGGVGIPDLDPSQFAVTELGVSQIDYLEITPPNTGGGVRIADVVFVLDVSGSMGGELAAVKANMLNFILALDDAAIDYRVGFVVFADRVQVYNSGNLYSGLTTIQSIANGIRLGDSGVGNGGDYPENQLGAMAAATAMNFRVGAQRVQIMLTDASSHESDGVTPWTVSTCISQLQATNSSVYPVFDTGRSDQRNQYIPIANATNPSGQYYNIYANFNGIIGDIVSRFGSTYVIRYRSSRPEFDGVERFVNVACGHEGQTAEDSRSYIPGEVPSIQRTPETVALSVGQVYDNLPLTISCDVRDDYTPIVNSVQVFYRTTDTADYSELPMTKEAGDRWSATIPGAQVQPYGLDYYIRASDGVVTVTDPATDPAGEPYQLAVRPNYSPEVVYNPPAAIPDDVDYDVWVEVRDETDSIDRVELDYRPAGALLYQTLRMYGRPGNQYQATIPASNLNEHEDLEVRIRGIDNYGVATVSGPHLIDVAHQSLVAVWQAEVGSMTDNHRIKFCFEGTSLGGTEVEVIFGDGASETAFDDDGDGKLEVFHAYDASGELFTARATLRSTSGSGDEVSFDDIKIYLSGYRIGVDSYRFTNNNINDHLQEPLDDIWETYLYAMYRRNFVTEWLVDHRIKVWRGLCAGMSSTEAHNYVIGVPSHLTGEVTYDLAYENVLVQKDITDSFWAHNLNAFVWEGITSFLNLDAGAVADNLSTFRQRLLVDNPMCLDFRYDDGSSRNPGHSVTAYGLIENPSNKRVLVCDNNSLNTDQFTYTWNADTERYEITIKSPYGIYDGVVKQCGLLEADVITGIVGLVELTEAVIDAIGDIFGGEAVVACDVEAALVDDQGRFCGVVDGVEYENIPGASYSRDSDIWYFNFESVGGLRLMVEGQSVGPVDVRSILPDTGDTKLMTSFSYQTTVGGVAEFSMDPATAPRIGRWDAGGDGEFEEVLEARYSVNSEFAFHPVAVAGPDQAVECEANTGTVVQLDASGSYDLDDSGLSYTWTSDTGIYIGPTTDPVIDAAIPAGRHEILLTAIDADGNTGMDSVVVDVMDSTPPEGTITLSPNIIWPPNHKLVNISVRADIEDACDSGVTWVVESVTSSEPDEGLGDGDTSDDTQILVSGGPDAELGLRAERSGLEEGRIYTVTIRVMDSSGNGRLISGSVVVPHARTDLGVAFAGITGESGDAELVVLIPGTSLRNNVDTGLLDDGYDPLRITICNTAGEVSPSSWFVKDMDGDGILDGLAAFNQADLTELGTRSTELDGPPTILLELNSGEHLAISLESAPAVSTELATKLANLRAKVEVTSNTDFLQKSEVVARAPGISSVYPNPFNPSTQVVFYMKATGKVRIDIFNLAGRRVRTLFNERVSTPGEQRVVWRGDDGSGQRAASGVYFIRMATRGFADMRRVVLLK